MLRDGIHLYLAILRHGIHLDFLGILDKLRHNDRMLLGHICRQTQEAFKLLIVAAHIHGCTGKHIARTHKHRESYLINKLIDVVKRCQLPPAGLVDSYAVKHCRELMAVFRIVNRLGGSSENGHTGIIKTRGKIIGYLTAHRQYHAMRLLKVKNIHHAFIGKLVEIESVTHIIISRHSLGIVVNHHRAPALTLHGHKSVDRTPVKLYRATDAVSTRAEHYNRAVVVEIVHIVGSTVVSKIKVIGHRGIFGCKSVNLLHHRDYTERFAQPPYLSHCTFHIGQPLLVERTRNLEVTESLLLCLTQQRSRQLRQIIIGLHLIGCHHYIIQLIEEPPVYLCKLMDTLYGISPAHRL